MLHLGFDPVVMLSLGMAGLLVVCIGTFLLLRDPRTVAPQQVTRSVWCAANQCRATVEFVEEVKTGFIERRVRHCSLKESGKRCHEDCCFDEFR
jgi:hypothetical protein